MDVQLRLPVQGITHFNSDKDRQRHRHWVRRLKDYTLNVLIFWVVLFALKKMALEGKKT